MQISIDHGSPLVLEGRGFVSAASGLVRLNAEVVVIADDAHHVGVFPVSGGLGRLVRVIDGDLPDEHAERKRHKPDFEAIVGLPPFAGFAHGALLAMGSGSTERREGAVLLGIGLDGGLDGRIEQRSLAGLYAPFRDACGELNVEGALVDGEEFVLITRAHGGKPENHVARYRLDALAGWLAEESEGATALTSVTPLVVGDVDGVPLGITDAAAHPGGGWVFSAVAEDTPDSYHDGALVGAAVGRVDATGSVTAVVPLAPAIKVEGVLVDGVDDSGTRLLMVTDADDPAVPAVMATGRLPH